MMLRSSRRFAAKDMQHRRLRHLSTRFVLAAYSRYACTSLAIITKRAPCMKSSALLRPTSIWPNRLTHKVASKRGIGYAVTCEGCSLLAAVPAEQGNAVDAFGPEPVRFPDEIG